MGQRIAEDTARVECALRSIQGAVMSQTRYVVVRIVVPENREIMVTRGGTRLEVESDSAPPTQPVPIPPSPGSPGSGGVVALLVSMQQSTAGEVAESTTTMRLDVMGDAVDLDDYAEQLEQAARSHREIVLYVHEPEPGDS